MEFQARFSDKQEQYLQNATHRWNFKGGAVRCGKTYLDYTFVIPKRILTLPTTASIMLLGNTINSVERNVLSPMRNKYSERLVGTIKQSTNKVRLFGREVMVMGADKTNQVARLQGVGLDYAYGDEVATWKKEVFDMLKSRLDKEHSVFDGTTNPEHPTHWLKQFIDSNADIYYQHYILDDNPYSPKEFREALKGEYKDSVLYKRFVLGQWAVAEGLIYEQFGEHPSAYMVDIDEDIKKRIAFMTIGVDFGGNKSKTTFVCSGFTANYKEVYVLKDYHIDGGKGSIDPDRLCREFYDFVMKVLGEYRGIQLKGIFCDSEAQYLINGIRSYFKQNGLYFTIGDSLKKPIRDRIFTTIMLLNTGRLLLNKECEILKGGLEGAVWSDKSPDTRLDDGTSDIDILDAFEYSIERYMGYLVPTRRTA